MKTGKIKQALFLLTIAIGMTASISLLFAQDMYLSRWEYLSVDQAGRDWGNHSFSPQTFKAASTQERGAMVASLIKSRYGIGKTKQEIKTELGKCSGFFWNESIPVYIVHERSKPGDNIWQVVFLPGSNGKISEVRIQNNKPPKPLIE